MVIVFSYLADNWQIKTRSVRRNWVAAAVRRTPKHHQFTRCMYFPQYLMNYWA